MKNKDSWKPSKFIYKKKKLRVSKNINAVSISSRLMGNIIANYYDTYIKDYANGVLLDLGCGQVPLYEVYRPYIKDNICVDWTKNSQYIDFSANLNEKLPFNNSIFDTIILSDVLEHIKEPKNLWNEMYRVLRKNGNVLLNVPFFYWLHEKPNDYFRYTKYALKSMSENAGFEILILKPVGGVPEILTDIIAKNALRLPIIGKLTTILIQNLTWIFLKTKIGKKISSVTSEEFPLGYFLIAQKR